MVSNEQLAIKIHALTKRKGLIEKNMFGGVAFMLNGNMCFGTLRDDLMVRVGPKRYQDALTMSHARPMDISGKPIKGFVFVNSNGWSKDAALKKWLDMGIDYAASLPKKTTMQKKAAR